MRLPNKNPLEWLVFGASLLLIGVIVALLVLAARTTRDQPARPEVFLGQPRQEAALFFVPVVVENRGGKAAAGVRVEVLVESDSGNGTERAGFDLPYSPAGSIRRGEVVFITDPRAGRISARVTGFELP
jgi:uncharacterized protein (TIGR02588 family)